MRRLEGDLPGSEGSVKNVPDVDDVEATQMSLPVDDDTGSAHVSATGDHDDVSGLELDVVDDLVLDKVKLDSVVDLDGRVGVSDRSSVVGDEVGDALGTELVLSDLEELEGGLLGGDSVDGESALDVVEQSEVLARLLDRDDVCGIMRTLIHSYTHPRGPPHSPMNPAGKVSSVLTFPSTLISRCLTMAVTSFPVKAYFNRFRRKTVRGRDSRSLWGPGEGRGAWYRQRPFLKKICRSLDESFNSRRCRRACPASMMKELRAFSSAF